MRYPCGLFRLFAGSEPRLDTLGEPLYATPMSQAAPADGRFWAQCPACRGTERRMFVTFAPVSFARCRCGLVYKAHESADLLPRAFYEKSYFHGRKSGRDRRFAHRVRKCKRQLRMALGVQRVSRVLDVGCSFGYVLEAAHQLGLEAAGTDISSYAVEVCQERGYRAAVGDLSRLPFDDGEFDLVVMKHVLEHTPDPRQALEEVRRVLAPGGLVMVMVPSLLYWKGWLLRRTYRYFRPDDLGRQHYFYCTPRTLETLLQSAQYNVLSASKAFVRRHGLPWPLEWLRFAGLWAWQRAATALFLQREAFAIAQRGEQ